VLLGAKFRASGQKRPGGVDQRVHYEGLVDTPCLLLSMPNKRAASRALPALAYPIWDL